MWCHVCKKLSDTILCPSCEEDLRKASYRYLFTHRCPVCGNPVLDASYTCPFCTEGTLSYGPYGKTLASLIKNYKFGGERSLVPLLSGLYLGLLSSMEHVLILPIPPAQKRGGTKKRGFDQIEVITSHLAKKRGGYPHLSLFTRGGKGKQFKTLSKEQRFREQTLQLTRSQRKKERFFFSFYRMDTLPSSSMIYPPQGPPLSGQGSCYGHILAVKQRLWYLLMPKCVGIVDKDACYRYYFSRISCLLGGIANRRIPFFYELFFQEQYDTERNRRNTFVS